MTIKTIKTVLIRGGIGKSYDFRKWQVRKTWFLKVSAHVHAASGFFSYSSGAKKPPD